jgi:hypothetical protein
MDASRTGTFISALLGIAGFWISMFNLFKARERSHLSISFNMFRESPKPNQTRTYFLTATNTGNRTLTILYGGFDLHGQDYKNFFTSSVDGERVLKPGESTTFNFFYSMDGPQPQQVVMYTHDQIKWVKKIPVPDEYNQVRNFKERKAGS